MRTRDAYLRHSAPRQVTVAKSLTRLGSDCNTRCNQGKGCWEADTVYSRIHITIETEQVLTMRGRDGNRVWCQKCGCEVDLADLRKREAIPGIAQTTFHGCLDSSVAQDEASVHIVNAKSSSCGSGRLIFRLCAVIRSISSKFKFGRTTNDF